MEIKMSKKIKAMIYIACTLWLVVFAQIIVTKAYVRQTDVTQAFARNQLAIEAGSEECREIGQKSGWVMGKIAGRLSEEKCREIADNLFGYEGGSRLSEHVETRYYVAYGFSNGISFARKVNGQTINMSVSITYDESEDKSLVYFGVPFVNVEF